LRQLLHIPIVHGHAEMGSAGNTVRRAYVDRAGENAWEKSRLAIADFWDAIETAMDSLRLDYRKARLYQDGMPACGLEEKIARDLAMQGVPNYRILLKLMERGATLEGTEDPDLLRTEYELIMSTVAGATDAGRSQGVRAARLRDLLDQRDRFHRAADRCDLGAGGHRHSVSWRPASRGAKAARQHSGRIALANASQPSDFGKHWRQRRCRRPNAVSSAKILTMPDLLRIVSALQEQMNATLSRSDALKPLAWLIVVLTTTSVLLVYVAAPVWLLIVAAGLLAPAIALYFIAFSFCLIKDRDALRSETYSLHKIAIEHGLTGDSITGVITAGAEDRRLLTRHKSENQP